MHEIVITDKTAGGRLDKAVIKYLDKASAGFVYKMLRKKNIVLNGSRSDGRDILKTGDVVTLYLADETLKKFSSRYTGKKDLDSVAGNSSVLYVSGSSSIKNPEDMKQLLKRRFDRNLTPDGQTGNEVNGYNIEDMIVYEDDNILAVNKPYGLLSQKANGCDISLNDLVKAYIPSDELFTPGIANRLDRNTSGIVLAGKNLSAQRCLNEAIKERHLKKLYLCIVSGIVDSGGSISGYLIKDDASNSVRIEMDNENGKFFESAKYIRTDFKVLCSGSRSSLLLVDLITGRSHQIRAHLASIAHPVIGDPKYSDNKTFNEYRKKYGVTHQMLHAYKIEFTDMNGILGYLNGMSFTSQVPGDFYRVIQGDRLCLPGIQEA